MYFLCDCNNFYASCERLFRPGLRGVPIVVLSNNDGCIVARSQEAKELKIPMGAPFFKYKNFLKAHDVAVFSSNYALYGDISSRVMSTLAELGDKLEVYSIDEAFVENQMFDKKQCLEWAKYIRDHTSRLTGIPVSLGVGRTKTLAKVANQYIKSTDRDRGVWVLGDDDESDRILKKIPVADIWGLGRASAKKLSAKGIYTAYGLKYSDPEFVKTFLGINGWKTCKELNGFDCVDIAGPEVKQSMTCSRSFAKNITSYDELTKVTALFAHNALERLRKGRLVCKGLRVFIETSRFDNKPYFNKIDYSLKRATASTSEILMYVAMGLRSIYREGYPYKKSGVVLYDIADYNELQYDMFRENYCGSKDEDLMTAVDAVNKRYGKTSLSFATAFKQNIKTTLRREFISPEYTSSWDEIVTVKAV